MSTPDSVVFNKNNSNLFTGSEFGFPPVSKNVGSYLNNVATPAVSSFKMPTYNNGLASSFYRSADSANANIGAVNNAYTQNMTPAQLQQLNADTVNAYESGAFNSGVAPGLTSGLSLDSIKSYGGLAANGLGIMKGFDDLFGSGKEARDLAMTAGKVQLGDFIDRSNQRKKDTARFEQTRDAQTAAYNAPRSL